MVATSWFDTHSRKWPLPFFNQLPLPFILPMSKYMNTWSPFKLHGGLQIQPATVTHSKVSFQPSSFPLSFPLAFPSLHCPQYCFFYTMLVWKGGEIPSLPLTKMIQEVLRNYPKDVKIWFKLSEPFPSWSLIGSLCYRNPLVSSLCQPNGVARNGPAISERGVTYYASLMYNAAIFAN
jgi:hypothetical protein